MGFYGWEKDAVVKSSSVLRRVHKRSDQPKCFFFSAHIVDCETRLQVQMIKSSTFFAYRSLRRSELETIQPKAFQGTELTVL